MERNRPIKLPRVIDVVSFCVTETLTAPRKVREASPQLRKAYAERNGGIEQPCNELGSLRTTQDSPSLILKTTQVLTARLQPNGLQAKKRNMSVPVNSPGIAMKWPHNIRQDLEMAKTVWTTVGIRITEAEAYPPTPPALEVDWICLGSLEQKPTSAWRKTLAKPISFSTTAPYRSGARFKFTVYTAEQGVIIRWFGASECTVIYLALQYICLRRKRWF